MTFNDFLRKKKMRDARTIVLAAVSRQDLYYVSENESFCFGLKTGNRSQTSCVNEKGRVGGRGCWTFTRTR